MLREMRCGITQCAGVAPGRHPGSHPVQTCMSTSAGQQISYVARNPRVFIASLRGSVLSSRQAVPGRVLEHEGKRFGERGVGYAGQQGMVDVGE